MLDQIEIGNRLKQLRESKNLSREEVAVQVGVCFSAIVSYESGKRVPRDSVKVKLANLYGQKVSTIFFDE